MIERPNSPSHWPQRSPINIQSGLTLLAKLPREHLDIQYPKIFQGAFTECDPGRHECEFKPSEGTVANIVFNGRVCPLMKLHFHSPSEHKVNGKAFPVEVHFVHKIPNSENGSSLVVIGVFLKRGTKVESPEGLRVFGQYLSGMSSRRRKANVEPVVDFHSHQFLPEKETTGEYAFFRYEGSLTTQSYGELVSWVVMRDAVAVGPSDLDRIVEKADHPAREPKQKNHRLVRRNFS